MLVQIVDDNETNLMLFEQIVRRVDGEVEIETQIDPVQALAACAKRMPDLILVDYMMPVVDGHQFVEQVRAMPGAREVPIVMVTAASDRHVRQKALELGATDFLAKPVDPSEVRARLINLLSLRRNHLRLKDQNRWLADEVRKATATIIDREQELIYRLSKAAEFRDPETGAHIVRMAHYSRLIAKGLGLPGEVCDLILRAAPMHDIGKLGIPDGILLKPGRLDSHEMEVMKSHPGIGHSILQGSNSQLIRMGAEIALSHHEKWDGSGYPNNVAGNAIPLTGRIVAVADVFDALTSERPYKKAWTLDKARALLEESRGTHFDPACVDHFVEQWDAVLTIHGEFQDDDVDLHLSFDPILQS